MSADAAASLGAVSDIWVIIALIIPGFIAFRILSWLAAYEAKFDQFTTTIYSLICSLIVFLPVALLNQLDSISDIRMAVIAPTVLAELIFFGVLFGIIPGLILKFTVRRKYAFGSAWDRFARNYVGKGVVVYTTDGKKYVGWVKRMSRGKEEAKEIAIGNPRLVKTKPDGNLEYVDLGEELLFTESAIHRILRRIPKESPSANQNEADGPVPLNRPVRNTQNLNDRQFNIRLADMQLMASVSIAIGSTLLAVGVGFAFTVLPALKTVIDEDAFNRELIRVLEAHTNMTINYSSPTGALQVLNGLTNLALTYAAAGALVTGAGFILTRIRFSREIRAPQ